MKRRIKNYFGGISLLELMFIALIAASLLAMDSLMAGKAVVLAMAATAVTKKASMAMLGGIFEVWQCSIDPASIAAAAQGIETIAIPGARAGDPVFANPEAMETKINPAGAKVTANDVVSVYINNTYDATTAVDGAAKVWNVMILKLSVGS